MTHQEQPLLSHRLRLEPLLAAHAAALFGGLQEDALYDFISDRPPASVEALERRYVSLARRKSPDGSQDWLNWAVWSAADEAYAGYVQATIGTDRAAEIAYVLFPRFQGRGLAREAALAMIGALRSEHGVVVFRAHVDTRNARSIALLRALGFAEVAVRLGAEEIRGVLTDEAEYLLRTP